MYFGVAHLTHQNHVGILPQDAAQGTGEVECILTHFNLFNDGFPVRMQVLDGILDGDDVIVAGAVYQIYQRRQCGAFSAACGPGNEDKSLPRLGEAAQTLRQMQRFKRRNFLRQQPNASRKRASLKMKICSKTADAGAAEAQVGEPVALQFLALRRRHQWQEQIPRAFRAEWGTEGVRQRTADA